MNQSIYEKALTYHKNSRGKWRIELNCKVDNPADLALAYTPGVAQPCIEIQKNPELAYEYTRKWNTIAVVSDGSAVLGLGNIGGLAALPVMEGKAILFKKYGNIDAFPLVLDTQNVDEIVETIVHLAPTLGGINLEDIAAPKCFAVQERLAKRLAIPVFHDDQWGTAIVVLAAITNALKVVNKKLTSARIVINGIGAAGSAISKLLLHAGANNLVLCDVDGIIDEKDKRAHICELAKKTNAQKIRGNLEVALVNADGFVGVSRPNLLTAEHIKTMNPQAVVFAMANPQPEILPDQALAGGAMIVGTGRSDFPNQINNVLVFPGLFRGILDARATEVSMELMTHVAQAIASYIPDCELSNENIISKTTDTKIHKFVAEATFKFLTQQLKQK